MKNKKWSLLAILLVLTLVLSACVGTKKSEGGQGDGEEKKPEVDKSLFPTAAKNDGKGIEGGTMNVALVTDTPFQGIFNYELYEDANDEQIMRYATNSIFSSDETFKITNDGIASLKVDTEAKKATIKIKKDVKWSDGKPLTIEDVIFPYEIIGHKDYTGVRYDGDMMNIVGIEEYHAGKAPTISGLKKIDESTLEISFKKISPAIYFGGDGLWTYAAPKHDLGNEPIKKLVSSDKVRKNPVTLGPWKYDKVVNGESVQLVANEHYWKGKPKIEKVVVEVVPSSSIVAALKEGKFDLVPDMKTDLYESYKDLDNLNILGREDLYYAYLGFNLGTWDKANNVVVTNPSAKMADEKLRQAMGFAMNVEAVSDEYYNGLRSRANSVIPPVFLEYHNADVEGYKYDPEKAKKILDEAGYKDTNNDGLREDKNGKPLEIKMAFMAGGETAEPVSQFYMQNWKEVGLNVVLSTGRLIEFNSFYDKVQANDPQIDIYSAAWGVGTNPSPAGTFGKDSFFNMPRYTDATMQKLVEDIDSPAATDPEKRKELFEEFQEYASEKAPVIPLQFQYNLYVANKRLKGIDISYEKDGSNYHEWELTEEEPLKAK